MSFVLAFLSLHRFSEFTLIFGVCSDLFGFTQISTFKAECKFIFFCAATHPCCTLPCWEGQRHLGGPKSSVDVSDGNFEFNLQIIAIAIELYV